MGRVEVEGMQPGVAQVQGYEGEVGLGAVVGLVWEFGGGFWVAMLEGVGGEFVGGDGRGGGGR